RDLVVDACAAAPSEHLAESHCVSLVAGHVEHVPGRRKYSFPVAFEPGDLGLRGRDGAQTSPLTGRLAQCPCLVEEFLVAGIATSRPDEPEHDEPEDVRHDRGAPDP